MSFSFLDCQENMVWEASFSQFTIKKLPVTKQAQYVKMDTLYQELFYLCKFHSKIANILNNKSSSSKNNKNNTLNGPCNGNSFFLFHRNMTCVFMLCYQNTQNHRLRAKSAALYLNVLCKYIHKPKISHVKRNLVDLKRS